jgi:predicted Abi (CAAX) family protease
VLRALRTRPKRRDWTELLLASAAFTAIAGPVGLATGLFTPGPADADSLLGTAAVALVAPALGEELTFRAALIPDRAEAPRAAIAIALSTAIFVGWHLVEGFTFLPAARGLFTRPDFLACAGLLGLACALLRRRSGTIWTAVLLHWAAVVVWKTWLGGPRLVG